MTDKSAPVSGLSVAQLDRIKALHQEFANYGMLDESWGIMAHETRGELIKEVERLRRALSEIQWQKDCGCDFRDPETGEYRNYPEVERDAMYQIATATIGPSRDALFAQNMAQARALSSSLLGGSFSVSFDVQGMNTEGATGGHPTAADDSPVSVNGASDAVR